MATYNDILDRCREILQDTSAIRYPDAQAVEALNISLIEIYRLRPDAFVNSYTTPVPTITVGTLGNSLDVHQSFEGPLIFLTTAWLELRDAEHVEQGRALGLMNRAELMLTGRMSGRA